MLQFSSFVFGSNLDVIRVSQNVTILTEYAEERETVSDFSKDLSDLSARLSDEEEEAGSNEEP